VGRMERACCRRSMVPAKSTQNNMGLQVGGGNTKTNEVGVSNWGEGPLAFTTPSFFPSLSVSRRRSPGIDRTRFRPAAVTAAVTTPGADWSSDSSSSELLGADRQSFLQTTQPVTAVLRAQQICRGAADTADGASTSSDLRGGPGPRQPSGHMPTQSKVS